MEKIYHQLHVFFCSVAQLCLTLCDPKDCSPSGSSVHGIFQVRNTGVGCHFLLQGIFPTQGLNLCLSPVLAGRFFTTESLEKPKVLYEIIHFKRPDIVRYYTDVPGQLKNFLFVLYKTNTISFIQICYSQAEIGL